MNRAVEIPPQSKTEQEMSKSKIVHAQLKLRIGGYNKFCESMPKLVALQESCGWKLLGAYCTRLGRVYNIVHIWEIPDANSFFDAIENMTAKPAIYATFSGGLAETIEEENIAMC